jgi:calcineurin-like phosphoesterase family protein
MIPCDDVFFTSDTHFGHTNILKYAERPFASIEEHDEALIEAWNEVVTESGAHVYHLGDFVFGKPRRIEEILPRLNGQIHLILGNHDKHLRKGKTRDLFASVSDYKSIRVKTTPAGGEQRIVLMHYPIESWDKRHYGSWHLHGHCHGTLPSAEHQRRVDVGVDVWNYRPVTFEQLEEHMAAKVFKAIDHHRNRDE